VGRPRRPAWFAWWYVSIAAGFLLLAIRAVIVGGWTWLIVVRIVIALGFAGLAWAEMRRNAIK
jgi:tetrahydromethanopterin S-methyltransferase subunit C